MRAQSYRLTMLGFLLLLAAAAARASEYCVVCIGPDASYRCMTNDGRTDAGTDQRDWLPCVSAIAKSGQHDSCSIDRKSTAPCSGEVRNVDTSRMEVPAATPAAPPVPAQPPMQAEPANPDHRPAPAPAQPSTAAQPPPPTTSPGSRQAEPAPPAGETIGPLETSKDNLDKAGSAIGNAAKRTWDCMSSFFKKC